MCTCSSYTVVSPTATNTCTASACTTAAGPRVPGLRRLFASRPGRMLARPFAFTGPIDREINDVGGRVVRGYSFYREARRLGIAFDIVEASESDAVALGFAVAGWQPLVINLRCPPVTTYWRLHGYEPPGVRARSARTSSTCRSRTPRS